MLTPPDVPASLLPPEMVIVTKPTPQPDQTGDAEQERQVTEAEAVQNGAETASCADVQIAVTSEDGADGTTEAEEDQTAAPSAPSAPE